MSQFLQMESIQAYYENLFLKRTVRPQSLLYYCIGPCFVRPLGVLTGLIKEEFQWTVPYAARRGNGELRWLPYDPADEVLNADYNWAVEANISPESSRSVTVVVTGSAKCYLYGEMFGGLSFEADSTLELKGCTLIVGNWTADGLAEEPVSSSCTLIEVQEGLVVLFACDRTDVVLMRDQDSKYTIKVAQDSATKLSGKMSSSLKRAAESMRNNDANQVKGEASIGSQTPPESMVSEKQVSKPKATAKASQRKENAPVIAKSVEVIPNEQSFAELKKLSEMVLKSQTGSIKTKASLTKRKSTAKQVQRKSKKSFTKTQSSTKTSINIPKPRKSKIKAKIKSKGIKIKIPPVEVNSKIWGRVAQKKSNSNSDDLKSFIFSVTDSDSVKSKSKKAPKIKVENKSSIKKNSKSTVKSLNKIRQMSGKKSKIRSQLNQLVTAVNNSKSRLSLNGRRRDDDMKGQIEAELADLKTKLLQVVSLLRELIAEKGDKAQQELGPKVEQLDQLTKQLTSLNEFEKCGEAIVELVHDIDTNISQV